jgi:hypothetical protein
MRRLLLSVTAAAALLTATARPARAAESDIFKEFVDCVVFGNVWCEYAREDADNWLEEWAVEFTCSLMPYSCFVKAIL